MFTIKLAQSLHLASLFLQGPCLNISFKNKNRLNEQVTGL